MISLGAPCSGGQDLSCLRACKYKPTHARHSRLVCCANVSDTYFRFLDQHIPWRHLVGCGDLSAMCRKMAGSSVAKSSHKARSRVLKRNGNTGVPFLVTGLPGLRFQIYPLLGMSTPCRIGHLLEAVGLGAECTKRSTRVAPLSLKPAGDVCSFTRLSNRNTGFLVLLGVWRSVRCGRSYFTRSLWEEMGPGGNPAQGHPTRWRSTQQSKSSQRAYSACTAEDTTRNLEILADHSYQELH